MLLLVFQLGADRYALDAGQVVEVLPMVSFKPIPQATRGVAGVINYHGGPVPLVDLSELALGKSSRLRMSTRIILVNYLEPSGDTHLLGLLAEQTTETIRRTEADFVDSGVAVDSAPYLGPVTSDAQGIIQKVEVNRLLPAAVRDVLFRQPLEPA
jgi:chemotaxis-related protein WspB